MVENVTNERTGGKWALSGFFYQAVGVAGLVARAHNLREQGQDGDDLDAMVEVSGLVPEAYYDQDAVLFPINGMQQNQCAFYQFKYSGSQNTAQLRADSFKEIVCAFVKGTRRAIVDGYTVFRYVLATNREISSTVTNWITKKALDDNGLKDIVDSLLGDQTATCTPDQREQIENEVKAVLLQFHQPVVPDNLPSYWKELNSYGERLGLNQELIFNGIRLLMADQFINGAEGRGAAITREVLNNAFTGCENPRELTVDKIKDKYPPDVSPLLRDKLENIADRRTVAESLETLIAAGKQLIILIGRGGAGKSSFLAKWVERSLKQYPDAMIEIKHANYLPDNWIAKTVSDWSGVLLLANCSNTDALRRLKIANGKTPHKLYLILDGIDETGGDVTNRIRQLLDEVYKSPSNVVLIVTCREMNWFENLLEPMGGMIKGELHSLLVTVDYFDSDEFSELVIGMNQSAVKDKLREIVFDNISTSVARSGFKIFGKDDLPFSDVPTRDEWESELFQALRHPVIWSCFTKLQEHEMNLLLIKDQLGFSAIGKSLFEWFFNKLQHRLGQNTPHNKVIEKALSGSAVASCTVAIFEDSIWIDELKKLDMSQNEVYKFLDEVESAGLVVRAGKNKWRWTNQLICKSFAALGAEIEVKTI